MKILGLFLGLSLFASAAFAAEPVLWTDQNIPGAVLNKLAAGQDLSLDKRYDEAVEIIRATMKEVPEHPLGAVFLIATRLSAVQEGFRQGSSKVPDNFFDDTDLAIDLGEAQRKAFPDSPYPKVYLGAAYGVRGLAKLYAGSYLASYRDGKRGAAMLKEAVEQDPSIYNAYMGLGQFEYYCGTLSGILQFVLALPGDPDKGLAMLKTCEAKGSYAAWPCKAYRVKLILTDRKDFAAVQNELHALRDRYPHNDEFAAAVFGALGAGINTASLRQAGADVMDQLDKGWQPPKRSPLKPEEARLILAKAYLAAGDKAAASWHFTWLVERGTSEHKREAQGLMDVLSTSISPAAVQTEKALP